MPTATRVLPWRRHQLPAAVEVAPVVDEFRRHHPRDPGARIITAYEVAAAAHTGHTRKSGEPYISHPTEVAIILAKMQLDPETLAAASRAETPERPAREASPTA